MPFKSKAQQRFFFAAESRGEFPKGTALEWAHATKNIKKLPEKLGPKEEAMKKPVYQKAASSCNAGGRGQLHKPGPEAIRKMAFLALAEASQRLPEKSAQVCQKLALAIGRGDSLQDALASCRLPVESRVKVARFVFSAVKQAASEDSESFGARLGEGLGKGVGSAAGLIGGGIVGAGLGAGPLRGPHRMMRHLLHFGARPMSKWSPKVARRAGLALLGPLLGESVGRNAGGYVGKQLGTEASQLPRLLP